MAIKLFQNILAYRHELPVQMIPSNYADLCRRMSERLAMPPSAQRLDSHGFVPPYGTRAKLIERVSPDTYVLAVRTYERLLPAKVVRAEVDRRVQKIEEAESRKCYAREKQQIKDEVVQIFLPRAFIDTRVTYAMIQGPHIYIDTSSAKRGEDVLCLLRETLGSLPVRPVGIKNTPIEFFTHWITKPSGENDLEGFELTGDFKANGGCDESDLLTGKGVSLDDSSMSEVLQEQGRRITQLGLVWKPENEEMAASFSINEMLGMKGIKWDESMSEAIADDVGETDDVNEQRLLETQATFLLLSTAIRNLWADLLAQLGGEEIPQKVGYVSEEELDEEDDLV